MGTYEPAQKRRRRSVADTLLEAEQEHYLDCPNADLPIRAAALLLDVILFSLASSGIHHLVDTLRTSLPSLVGMFWEPATPAVLLGINYLAWLLKTAALYAYFIWSVTRFGGTPAKLIMGLKVIDAQSGQGLSYQQALVRETIGKALGLIFLVGPLSALFRPDRKAVYDLMTSSVVKRVRGGP